MFQELVLYEAGVSRTLSLEDVMRCTLEVFLSILGPLNLALFVPQFGGDWQIGAFVNYGNNISSKQFEDRVQGFANKIESLEEDLRSVEYWTKNKIPDKYQPVDLGAGALFEAQNLLITPCVVKGELLCVLIAFSPFAIDVKSNKRAIKLILDVLGNKLEELVKIGTRCKFLKPIEDDSDDLQTS